MNRANENQHHLSRVLLVRFKEFGSPLHCYQVDTGNWIPRGLDNLCASPGYNQLIIGGRVDNSTEDFFSKIESRLPRTLGALERAAGVEKSELTDTTFENFCRYCAMLKLISLPAKASAIAAFVIQINWELSDEKFSLLRELQVPQQILNVWREAHRVGQRVIFRCDNALQLIYQHQFRRNFWNEVSVLEHTKWTVGFSPIELPLSDMGLIPVHAGDDATHYLLPIGPHLAVLGVFWRDLSKNKRRQPVRGVTYTTEEANFIFDAICGSAVREVICRKELEGVPDSVARSKKDNSSLLKVVDVSAVTSAGSKACGDELRFEIVSADVYKAFVTSLVQP